MPLRPINIAQPAHAENRITAGAIVEYEQHGKAQLGFAVEEKKGKWLVVNQRNAEVELPAARLYLYPGSVPLSLPDSQAKSAYLERLSETASQAASRIDLGEIWEVVAEEMKEASVKDLAEVSFGDNSLDHHLAMRRALLADQIYFKRGKSNFEPRRPEVVEELKNKQRIEAERQRKREELIAAVAARINGGQDPLPPGIAALEQLAALGRSAENHKDTTALLDEIIDRAGLSLSGSPESRAFAALERAGHFSADENLTLIRLGRRPQFGKDVIAEAEKTAATVLKADLSSRLDLSQLLTVTIDDVQTRDIDDALSLEETDDGCRVGIHISDVSAFLPRGSLLEAEALERATSVYTIDQHIPMLPRALSEKAFSLVEGEPRLTMSFFIDLDRDCRVTSRKLLRSQVKVSHRLNYDEVDKLLYGEVTPLRTEQSVLSDILLKLWDIACALEARRLSAGAYQFTRREMSARILEDGKIVLEESNDDTPARKLVSELMILANHTAALFAKDAELPILYRGQDPPDVDISKQGLHISQGPAREYFQRGFIKRSSLNHTPMVHSGLGLDMYTYITSPIRRVIDLVNQRQIGDFVQSGARTYSADDLSLIMATIAEGLDNANQIQRERNRYWLQKYLVQQGIEEIEATIIRVDTPRPLAELDILHSLYPFHAEEGKNRNRSSLEKRLGERVKLRIDSIDPRSDTLVLREI